MAKVSHPRFVVFIVVLIGLAATLWKPFGPAHAVSAAFDISAVGFIAWIAIVMTRSDTDDIRRHADENDGGRAAMLLIAAALALVVLVTVASELHPGGAPTMMGTAYPVLTILVAWFFGNTVYTLHYAHLYYDQVGAEESGGGDVGDRGGLKFPNCNTPDYWDFAYFAFNLGMAFQVSDVTCTSRAMRRAVLAHCMIAFFFNIGVVALTINIVAGATGGGK